MLDELEPQSDALSVADANGMLRRAESGADRADPQALLEDVKDTAEALIRRARAYADDELLPAVRKSWRYYRGECDIPPAGFVGHDPATGKPLYEGSKIVITKCRDTVQMMLPDLVRVFLASEKPCVFQPQGPEDVEAAEQATDLAAYVFRAQNRGDRLIRDAMIDWCVKYAALKVYRHVEERETAHAFDGLDGAALELLRQDPDIVRIEAEPIAVRMMPPAPAQPEMMTLGGGMPMMEPPPGGTAGVRIPVSATPPMAMPEAAASADPFAFGDQDRAAPPDGTIGGQAPDPGAMYAAMPGSGVPGVAWRGTAWRLHRETGVKIGLIPHEELLIDPDAASVEEALCVGQDGWRTVSDLVAAGVPYETATRHAGQSGGPGARGSETYRARTGRTAQGGHVGETGDPALDYVRTVEAVVRVDRDGDGITETYRVLALGDEPEVVAAVPCDDCHHIVASPYTIPHRPLGDGVVESVMDLQDLATTAMRRWLDNLNRVINPRPVISGGDGRAWDDLNSWFGGPIRLPPGAGLDWHVVPFVGQHSAQIVDYVEGLAAMRTGVSAAAQGLDPNVLKGQTLEGAHAIVAAPQSRLEFLIRQFAQDVMAPLFRAILKLLVQYQDQPLTIRLRNRWVPVDPRPWRADMDCTPQIGLGTGTRAERLVGLQMLLARQEQLLAAGSPLVTVKEYRETLADLAEALGQKDADRFFKDPSDEELAAAQQQAQQGKLQEAEMLIRLEAAKEEAKARARSQGDQAVQMARQQADAQLAAAKLQAEREAALEAARLKAAAEEQAAARRAEQDAERLRAEIALQDRRAQLDFDAAMRKAAIEQELAREKLALQERLKMAELAAEKDLELLRMRNRSPAGNANLPEIETGGE